jgi:hypothetical protein
MRARRTWCWSRHPSHSDRDFAAGHELVNPTWRGWQLTPSSPLVRRNILPEPIAIAIRLDDSNGTLDERVSEETV